MQLEQILREDIYIDEETHKYYFNNIEITKPSVSKIIQLLPQHIFDDSFAQTEEGRQILAAGILRGIHLHNIAEHYIKTNLEKTCCQLWNHNDMKKWLITQIKKLIKQYNENDGWEFISELSIIGNEYVGTLDLLIINSKTKEYMICDIKSTKRLNKEKEALQINLYNLLVQQQLLKLQLDGFNCLSYFVINCHKNNQVIYKFEDKILNQAEIETDLILDLLNN